MARENKFNKVVAICQPNFLPWLGYFEMAHRADIFVMLDDVQYVRREWVNRNRIPSRDGSGWQWLTVPLKKSPRDTRIRDVEISYEIDWPRRFMKTIEHKYAEAPYFEDTVAGLADVLLRRHRKLIDLNMAVLRFMYAYLNIPDNLVMSSGMGVSGSKDDKLAAICEALGASVYLANNGSKPYIQGSKFTEKGIGFIFQDYEHPVYKTGRSVFQPCMSALDLFFWEGPKSLEIIIQGRTPDWKDYIGRSSAG